MSVWGIVVAAGRGERAGLGRNKVFFPLHGRSVLSRCVDALAASGQFDGLVLVIAAADEAAYRELIGREGENPLVRRVVTGGDCRRRSVYNGLRALPDPEQQTFAPAPASVPLRLVGEVFKTYIITEREGELCLIDKHAAHERILFEQLSEQYGDVPAQLLLVPVQVNLSAEEKQAVMDNLELLRDAGIEAEDYGGPTVVVRAVPADVPVDDVSDMLLELADRLKNGGHDALREKTEWVLHSIACRAAIKAGDRTTEAEMLALAQKIMDGTVPPFCPHGRPCVLKITRKELEKQFGRLV